MSGKNNKLPRLRFPEFRDAGEWEEHTLKQLAKFRRGSFPQPYGLPEWYDKTNGLPFIQVFDVNDDLRLKPTTKRKISKLAAEKSVFIAKGTLIITIQGSIGRVAVTQYDAYIDRTLLLFEKFLNPTNKLFFAYSIQKLFEIEREKAPGGIIKTITKEVLSNFKIKLPTLPEQQKIADCLSSLDDLITAQGQKLAQLKTHKKGLMQLLFPAEGETQPKLRFPEFQDAGDWEEREVGELFRVTRGDVLSMMLVKERECETSPFPVYSSQTKNNGLAGYYSEYLYENAITWTTDGANAGDVNFRKGKFFCTNVCGVLLNSDGYTNTFVAELLNSVTKKHVSYVGNPKLMNGVMGKITIPFPTLSEQQKIADCLSSLDDIITAQAQKLAQLKTHKKGLMQQMFPAPDEVNG